MELSELFSKAGAHGLQLQRLGGSSWICTAVAAGAGAGGPHGGPTSRPRQPNVPGRLSK